ncbi:MAG: hypothetical protein MUC94_14985 [bacterium]|nr:hypothetical protein [bacterium]
MTAYATAQTAVEAMRKGAYDYLIKPFEMVEMKLKVKHHRAKRGDGKSLSNGRESRSS